MSPDSERGWFQAKPRIAVEGGVVVPKPGKVDDPDALDLIHAAQMEGRPPILSRGRTYARQGQVIGVEDRCRTVQGQHPGLGAPAVRGPVDQDDDLGQRPDSCQLHLSIHV